ncbi:MAG: alpha-amylase [Muribaculaceae bacterium]|nr:alpha-amylase [Muribaculaceae bacterium]
MVIYQLFPRLFTNVNSHCVANGTRGQNGCGKMNDITSELLLSLKQLGVTAVWYTGIIRHATTTHYNGIPDCHPGIVKGRAGSPYAISDYYDVNPDIAQNVPNRMEEFHRLVERTHRAGMQVIIDFVPNHVARQYHSIARPSNVEDLGAADDHTKFFDADNNFYYITHQSFSPSFDCGDYHEFPAKATGNDCYHASPGRGDWYETVKLNYGINPKDGSRHFNPVPDTWHKMFHILHFWADKGIDAFRCDMAHMVPVEFWRWAIAQIKAVHPALKFIAEIYDTALYPAFVDAGFDYLYDKVTLYDSLINVLNHNQSAQSITRCWQTTEQVQNHMLHFLENHDEVRLASTQCCGDAFKALPALVLSAFLTPSPMMIYAGQELGEDAHEAEGFSGHDGRTTIFDYWSVPTVRDWLTGHESASSRALRKFYEQILCLRQSENAFSQGLMHDLMYANPHLDRQFAFLRGGGKEVALVVTNFQPTAISIELTIPQHAFEHMSLPHGTYWAQDLLAGLHGHEHAQDVEVSLLPNEVLRIDLQPHNALVWKLVAKSENKK